MTDLTASLTAALAGRYTLERELGRGGMATVYLAIDLRHQRQVALKVLKPELAAAMGGDRFLREITVTAGLHHPHILPLLESGEAGGFLYYTMPFVAGESLRDRLKREKQLPVDEALRITREVADALDQAHRQGIIHRDIKPENILLEEGHALVADFGIARAVAATDAERLTETGLAVGTPGYMSPEQATATKELDGRSDLYSLGCVLYEMLVGEAPYTGPSAQAILVRKLSEPLPSITAVREAVTPGLEAAIRKALARSAADRFQTVAAFRAALEPATLAAFLPPTRAAHRRPWAGPAVALAVVAVAVLGVAVYFRSGGRRVTMDPALVAVMPFQMVAAGPEVQELARQLPTLFWMQLTGEFGPRATDPATVIPAWEAAGGTPEGGLAIAHEIELATRLRAGRLVRGAVTGAGDRMAITASLVEVPSGAVRVPQVTVRTAATAAGWLRAVDSLIGLVLAKDANEFGERVAPLAHYPPEAVQAYLAGLQAKRRSDFKEAGRFYDRALAADSTFLLAALAKFDAGEGDWKAARYLWAHRNQLSPRERAYFTGLAGWNLGVYRTGAEVVAQWDSITRAWPEWGTAWTNLTDKLIIYGSVSGVPRWRERAWAARDSALRVLKGADKVPVQYGCELAWGEPSPDTTFLRQCVEEFPPAGQSAPDLLGAWRLALLQGDTAEAGRRFAEAAARLITRQRLAPHVFRMIAFAAEDGRGAVDVDRLLASMDTVFYHRGVFARIRGYHAAWVRARDSALDIRWPLAPEVWRVQDALFLGEEEDSIAREAARMLAATAADDPGSYPAICWSTLWAIRHGDTTQARATARYLQAGSSRTDDCPLWRPRCHDGLPVCAGLIEVGLTEAGGGDLRAAVLRWDSIVRPFPVPYAPRPDWTEGIDNLLLSRLLLRVGDPVGALAAARRRPMLHRGWVAIRLVVDLLREEGRLAALTGDTAGAIKAYNQYLAMRQDPDWGPWRAARDSVRNELAALVSR